MTFSLQTRVVVAVIQRLLDYGSKQQGLFFSRGEQGPSWKQVRTAAAPVVTSLAVKSGLAVTGTCCGCI